MACAFVLGGARSGKSAYAERLASKLSRQTGYQVTYLATSQISDHEMAKRIEIHQQQRPKNWRTVEEPLEISAWLNTHQQPQIVLLDCLSLLLNNWMFVQEINDEQFTLRRDQLVTAIVQYPHPIVIVSNEVGQGIVPADALTRQYRDWLGWLNQAVAAASQHVYFVVAGIPIDVRKWQAEDTDI